MKKRRFHPQRSLGPAFTIVELMVVVAIIAVLAAMAVAASGSAQAKSAAAECASNLRNLGAGLQLYSADHGGVFPRSFHSAGASREPGWATSIAPYLGIPEATAEDWKIVFNKLFRCPADKNSDPMVYSYGLNVFFELDPDGDDYVGAPASWRRTSAVSNPSRTILMAEVESGSSGAMTADHFMCHQWSSVNAAKNAVAHERHSGKSNFLFVDGHVAPLPIADTFTSRTKNLWNPSTAGAP